ncbi:MAG: hypothetical protein GX417_10115 [Clostridiales bacterium]|nr:hypothetical protein [Clostridiales bacterium]
MAKLPGFFWTSFWIFLVSIVLITLFIWLFARGKKSYSVDDTESHAESYANVIKEGHGGMTAFLWVSFALIFSWTVYYVVVNWSQFKVIAALRNILG